MPTRLSLGTAWRSLCRCSVPAALPPHKGKPWTFTARHPEARGPRTHPKPFISNPRPPTPLGCKWDPRPPLVPRFSRLPPKKGCHVSDGPLREDASPGLPRRGEKKSSDSTDTGRISPTATMGNAHRARRRRCSVPPKHKAIGVPRWELSPPAMTPGPPLPRPSAPGGVTAAWRRAAPSAPRRPGRREPGSPGTQGATLPPT